MGVKEIATPIGKSAALFSGAVVSSTTTGGGRGGVGGGGTTSPPFLQAKMKSTGRKRHNWRNVDLFRITPYYWAFDLRLSGFLEARLIKQSEACDTGAACIKEALRKFALQPGIGRNKSTITSNKSVLIVGLI
jgi:hypothetical protein